MFEARLNQGILLRKLLDSMKDLVQVMLLKLIVKLSPIAGSVLTLGNSSIWLRMVPTAHRCIERKTACDLVSRLHLRSTELGCVLQDANFDCSSTGFALQAMDSSHVSLIHMQVSSK
jgi:hypothetical protein